ncbi:metal-dependent hydrolase [Magnetofaba australis]|uniref:Putative membrane-bound metal-dependent hydrolase n=1 Tax=Magnetofaba australis IT-1 TaxID=1434232 RepID=A0A1Y2K5Y3_9PROT|nr:metal-dependent hydrolase [Magnetofaba australis]OSM05091.1 putative membrane-bound metal-dependent hydrolase [Magnetofaba australis IT-1]
MADFSTHLSVGAAVSGAAATLVNAAGVINADQTLLLFTLGTIGGLLPDLDSDTSTPLKAGFTFLATLFGFVVMFGVGVGRYSVLELILLWWAAFLMIRYGVFALFTQLTKHRGIIHSVPAGALFAAIAIVLADRLFLLGITLAWLSGLFVLLGFLTHLLLDELVSLNLLKASGPRKSLGTAFKLFSNDWRATAGVYLALGALWFVLPPAPALFQLAALTGVWRAVLPNLLPHGSFFDITF